MEEKKLPGNISEECIDSLLEDFPGAIKNVSEFRSQFKISYRGQDITFEEYQAGIVQVKVSYAITIQDDPLTAACTYLRNQGFKKARLEKDEENLTNNLVYLCTETQLESALKAGLTTIYNVIDADPKIRKLLDIIEKGDKKPY